MKKLSIIIPFFNEEENILRIYEELKAVLNGALKGYAYEILFLDNHSIDKSFDVAVKIASQDVGVRVVRLSRNFGYQANILTGYLESTGDAVIQLDADGEDDPILIADFVRFWEQGYKIVYGIRKVRIESFALILQRKIFYRLLSLLSDVQIPLDAGDFRLLDRQVVENLRGFKEANLYLRGLIAYMGFKQKGIEYSRRKRFKGESKFSWWNYFQFAWDGITSLSKVPLSLAAWLSFVFLALSFGGIIFYLGLYLFHGHAVPGFTTLVLLHLFLTGIQLLVLGLIGTYLGRIFDEVKARPRSIIEQSYSSSSENRNLND